MGKLSFFLIASFLSSIGDTLLIFAIPVGLGLDFDDIRPAILMWFVPSIAMYLSSYLAKWISRREGSSRIDYAKFLLGISIIEILAACIAINLESRIGVLIVTSIFVFFYALIKEGIPRILYNVSMYRYFVSDHEYAKATGLKHSLDIISHIIGGLIATFLITKGDWRYALVFDALTFVIFGLVLLFVGRDYLDGNKLNSNNKKIVNRETKKLLKIIRVTVPLYFGLNALSWSYLSLIAEKIGALDIKTGLLAMAFLKVPGMILGALFPTLKEIITEKRILFYIPLAYFKPPVVYIYSGTSCLLSINRFVWSFYRCILAM